MLRPMTGSGPRLLYLSNAFPPGVTGRFPWVNPAGHATETRMAQALARHARVTSIGLISGAVFGGLQPRDDSLGLEHELLLWERRPALWHRWFAWQRLRRFYRRKVAVEGPPDMLLVRNLAPVFHRFVRWLRRQPARPVIVLVLADSGTLGRPVSRSRRIRYALKPMQTLDDRAIHWYDACIGFGVETKRFFAPRGVPWMWMPSAFNFPYEPPADHPLAGPIRFGYFGALAEHAAVLPMARLFLETDLAGTLHVCGFGKLAGALEELAARDTRLRFDGLQPSQAACLAWAQRVDVLVNPRLPIWGLENSFPSKVFEFAMAGKAILTTRTGGVDAVLGADGLYLETGDFDNSFKRRLREVAALDRAELQRRGAALRHRILRDYNWDTQARRMVEFLAGLVKPGRRN